MAAIGPFLCLAADVRRTPLAAQSVLAAVAAPSEKCVATSKAPPSEGFVAKKTRHANSIVYCSILKTSIFMKFQNLEFV